MTKKCEGDQLCVAMVTRLSPNGSLRPVVATSVENVDKFIGVSLHIKPNDRGVMVNVCPFCGGSPGCFKGQVATANH